MSAGCKFLENKVVFPFFDEFPNLSLQLINEKFTYVLFLQMFIQIQCLNSYRYDLFYIFNLFKNLKTTFFLKIINDNENLKIENNIYICYTNDNKDVGYWIDTTAMQCYQEEFQ